MRRTVLGVFAILLMLAASGCAIDPTSSGSSGDESTGSGESANTDGRAGPGVDGRQRPGGGSETTLTGLTVSGQGQTPQNANVRIGDTRQGPHPEPWKPGDDKP